MRGVGARDGPKSSRRESAVDSHSCELDDRFRETSIFREAGVHGTGELLVDSLFRID